MSDDDPDADNGYSLDLADLPGDGYGNGTIGDYMHGDGSGDASGFRYPQGDGGVDWYDGNERH